MRNRTGLCRLAGVLLALGALAPAAGSVVQSYPQQHAVVNWSRGAATVQGYASVSRGASPAAIRRARAAALADARRNVVALATRIAPITGDSRRQLAMTAAVRKVAARCRILHEKRAGGLYEVTLRVPINGRGGLSEALSKQLRKPAPFVPVRSEKSYEVASRDMPTTTGEEDLLTQADAKGPFTGLIVDARGFELQNSMCPVLYDDKLKEIYSGGHADVEFVEDVGVVGYMGTIKAALATSRVGKNPLIVRAAGCPDQFHRCATVSEEDAARIRAAEKDAGFFTKCAVTFVIDKAAGSPPQ